MNEIEKNTLSVDAAYSSKSGIMEYRGIWTDTGELCFEKSFDIGTNNIGEFLAVVHAIAYLKAQGKKNNIYTDSVTAIAWIKNKKVNTNLKLNEETKNLWSIIIRAEKWLKENHFENKILKWKTSEWGEVKADYDRK